MTGRNLIALACLYVAFSGLPSGLSLPIPSLPSPGGADIEVPTVRLREAVAGVAKVAQNMSGFDRQVWMATWKEAARLVDGERLDGAAITFHDTIGLRAYTGIVLDIAWKRLAKASGKYDGLADAVEEAFADTIGNDVKPFDEATKRQTVELFKALAWAGARGE